MLKKIKRKYFDIKCKNGTHKLEYNEKSGDIRIYSCFYCKSKYVFFNKKETGFYFSKEMKAQWDLTKIESYKKNIESEFSNIRQIKPILNENCRFTIIYYLAGGVYKGVCSCGYELGVWQHHFLCKSNDSLEERRNFNYFTCNSIDEVFFKIDFLWKKHVGLFIEQERYDLFNKKIFDTIDYFER